MNFNWAYWVGAELVLLLFLLGCYTTPKSGGGPR